MMCWVFCGELDGGRKGGLNALLDVMGRWVVYALL